MGGVVGWGISVSGLAKFIFGYETPDSMRPEQIYCSAINMGNIGMVERGISMSGQVFIFGRDVKIQKPRTKHFSIRSGQTIIFKFGSRKVKIRANDTGDASLKLNTFIEKSSMKCTRMM